MKIHIAYDFKDGPWGGGNQFLKALRGELQKHGKYTANANEAQVVFFNSYPSGEEYRFRQACQLKRRGAILIHRVDGPISIIRNQSLEIDRMIYDFNASAADGTVFQSPWSRSRNAELGMKPNTYETVIMNAPDPALFNTAGKSPFDGHSKIRLIATSWSSNPGKGFDTYAYLDEHLDFGRYEMTFVGQSPRVFRRIKMIEPLASEALAEQLKQHDIFITASGNDPCSNSLIEALHCGLPAVYINDGGHPWIVGEAGEPFEGPEDVLQAVDKIADGYSDYQNKIDLPDISTTAASYYEFAEKIYSDYRDGGYSPRTFGILQLYGLLFRSQLWRFRSLIR